MANGVGLSLGPQFPQTVNLWRLPGVLQVDARQIIQQALRPCGVTRAARQRLPEGGKNGVPSR